MLSNKFWLSQFKEVQFMGKHSAHTCSPLVLVCTLSTCCEDNTRMLPGQVIHRLVQYT